MGVGVGSGVHITSIAREYLHTAPPRPPALHALRARKLAGTGCTDVSGATEEGQTLPIKVRCIASGRIHPGFRPAKVQKACMLESVKYGTVL